MIIGHLESYIIAPKLVVAFVGAASVSCMPLVPTL